MELFISMASLVGDMPIELSPLMFSPVMFSPVIAPSMFSPDMDSPDSIAGDSIDSDIIVEFGVELIVELGVISSVVLPVSLHAASANTAAGSAVSANAMRFFNMHQPYFAGDYARKGKILTEV